MLESSRGGIADPKLSISDNNLALPKHELDKVGKTSVELRGNRGYLASLDVIHELHCLVRSFP